MLNTLSDKKKGQASFMRHIFGFIKSLLLLIIILFTLDSILLLGVNHIVSNFPTEHPVT